MPPPWYQGGRENMTNFHGLSNTLGRCACYCRNNAMALILKAGKAVDVSRIFGLFAPQHFTFLVARWWDSSATDVVAFGHLSKAFRAFERENRGLRNHRVVVKRRLSAGRHSCLEDWLWVLEIFTHPMGT